MTPERRTVRVELLPGPHGGAVDTAVVIDVIRATTTAVLTVAHGAASVIMAPSYDAARALKRARPDALLAGESGGLPPPGFELGNSPLEVTPERLAGRPVIMATTNGTRAAHAVAGRAAQVLLGALVNLDAVCREAAHARSVSLVCAGKEGQSGLDDAYTAGRMVEHLIRHGFTPQGDGAHFALAVCRAHPDPLAALRGSDAALALEGIGNTHDVPRCAVLNATDIVPVLIRSEADALEFSVRPAHTAPQARASPRGPSPPRDDP